MKTIVSGHLQGERVQVAVEDGVIIGIGDLPRNMFEGATSIETGGRLLPGFIDVHVHGGGGAAVMDGTEEAFEQVAYTHATHGTTGLLLTTVTDAPGVLDRVFRAYRPERQRNGAEVLGFHLEGPFISMEKPGAQPKQHIIPPSVELFHRWQELSQGSIRYTTLAPEVPGAEGLVKELSRQGVIVAMGHCNGSAKEVLQGIQWGAQSVTHLFNAMSAANHREPGLAGTALGDDRLTVELIADGIHVHPLMMRTALRAKGPAKVLLITDAVAAADLPDGVYGTGDREVTVRDGAVRLRDGTLAGSTLTLDRAVRNLLEISAITPMDVPQVTSINQANLLRLPHGRIAIGAPGSLIAVNEKWEVTHTIVRGRLVYRG